MEKVHVSKMSGKLEGFRAVNFNPLTSSFCAKMAQIEGSVCSHCYSRKMIGTYRKSCAKPFTANAELMLDDLPNSAVPTFNAHESVRFLAHGDIDTAMQLLNFFVIAFRNNRTQFTMWTKRVDLVGNFANIKPANLKIIQSSVRLNEADELAEGFDAVFTVYDDADKMPKDTAKYCAGTNCRECMYCYKHPAGKISELLRP